MWSIGNISDGSRPLFSFPPTEKNLVLYQRPGMKSRIGTKKKKIEFFGQIDFFSRLTFFGALCSVLKNRKEPELTQGHLLFF